jgi:hypothetical protein
MLVQALEKWHNSIASAGVQNQTLFLAMHASGAHFEGYCTVLLPEHVCFGLDAAEVRTVRVQA